MVSSVQFAARTQPWTTYPCSEDSDRAGLIGSCRNVQRVERVHPLEQPNAAEPRRSQHPVRHLAPPRGSKPYTTVGQRDRHAVHGTDRVEKWRVWQAEGVLEVSRGGDGGDEETACGGP